jgi:hypothetical protein
MATTTANTVGDTEIQSQQTIEPRHFKASELPLPSATRAAIESLAHAFKKEGAYDTIRKQVWDKFKASVRDHVAQVENRIN